MKILVVDGSNRNGGNSCMAISMLERALAEHEVKSLTLRQSDCRFCLACDGVSIAEFAEDGRIKTMMEYQSEHEHYHPYN